MKHDKALQVTIEKMVPAVLIAMISTGLGLLSLYRSKVPMINDFGAMLTIGIVIAFFIGIFIFLPLLYIRDKHFPKVEKSRERNIKNSNKSISRFVGVILKMKYVILSFAVILAVIGIVVDQQAKAETNLENFMPQDSQALADIRELRELIGSTEQIAIIIEDTAVLDYENLVIIKNIENLLNNEYQEQIIETSSLLNIFSMMGINDFNLINDTTLESIPVDQRKLFINETQTKTVINVSMRDMDDQAFGLFLDDLREDIQDMTTETNITITGQSVIDSEMMDALTTGRYEITIIGLVLIFLSLLVIYKSFYRAILPIIPIILIVGWSGGVMAMFNISYTPLTATLGALIMGIGTEFTILITERFEEEKLKTENRQEAIKNALSKMANPILVSALTTMGGFSALIFSDFVILSNFGIMTLVNLSLALLSTIVVLPTILAISLNKEVKVLEPAVSK
ncbi:MAG TPA: MMPL family transporter [Acholeplasmataceae bacterium]|nr:MMPL family transporter [Acholeplasmataceae bacterium]HRX44446.1 MMPL family transporter [Acholeplasmataceae bacterium]